MKILKLNIIVGVLSLFFCNVTLADIDLKLDSDEPLIVQKARKRLYAGGFDEQDLEVQLVLLKPQRKGNYLNAEAPDQTTQEEEF